jgi:hypothetical protein
MFPLSSGRSGRSKASTKESTSRKGMRAPHELNRTESVSLGRITRCLQTTPALPKALSVADHSVRARFFTGVRTASVSLRHPVAEKAFLLTPLLWHALTAKVKCPFKSPVIRLPIEVEIVWTIATSQKCTSRPFLESCPDRFVSRSVFGKDLITPISVKLVLAAPRDCNGRLNTILKVPPR